MYISLVIVQAVHGNYKLVKVTFALYDKLLFGRRLLRRIVR